ncbi:GNAT family N-acetyltransferase [Chloroflexota bacterium]
MATATTHLSNSTPPDQIRALNPRSDLSRVADLIELCFAETLDQDGQRYLNRMRRVGQHNRGRWFEPPSFYINLTAEGFVWQENGDIIGNISLIPFASLGRPIYLIANVAVHPDHRRKGIARALTMAALNHIQNRPIRSIWLQVRDNNNAAVRLYESIGFIERARRTTWTLSPGNLVVDTPSGARIIQHKSRHWKSQRKWLRQNYPDDLFWYWPISPNIFRPGIWGMLTCFFHEARMRQWAVEQRGQLRGILSWKTTSAYADQLWLAAPPESEELVLQTLLPYIHWSERAQRPLSINYPVNRAANTLSKAGFHPDHTLIWMEI